jgi:hypothetical protein
MDRHGFLPVGHSQTERSAAATPLCPTPCAKDRGVRYSRFRYYLGQYRSCIVMMHDGVPSGKVATSEWPGTSNELYLQQTARAAKQDGHGAHGVSSVVSGPTPPIKRSSTSSLAQTQRRIGGYGSRLGIDLLIVRAIECTVYDAEQ